jgi:hypothetical protein
MLRRAVMRMQLRRFAYLLRLRGATRFSPLTTDD